MEKFEISRDLFFALEKYIIEHDMDSDSESFEIIKNRLIHKDKVDADEFFDKAIYVVLASGFSQRNAKKKHDEFRRYFATLEGEPVFEDMFKIFGNENKVKAIIEHRENKKEYRDGYYKLKTTEEKLKYLSKLPHLGKITANHLARNLGENVVKYDIWIQRLGVKMHGRYEDFKLVGSPLNPKIKAYADKAFKTLHKATGYPVGYIDLILWKASQQKLL
ncbi:MAG: hypothetical protein LBR35_01265 [Rickettsiales bacterium]|jgi:thermostable 8-oxoguanine DNA glycosylase|nr:hypothetical protein [Rickettsiales bacterium]